jgi:pimeloyl-ACP methyl ester carboxylesterase
VLRLALLDTTAAPDAPDFRRLRLDRIDLARRGGFAKLPAVMLADLVHPDHVKDPRIAQAVVAMAERMGAETFIRQQTAAMNRPDNRPGLAAIAVPTLVIGGRQDSITPLARVCELARAIPAAKFVVIEEAGHLTPLEQPQAVSAVLRYWLQV